MIPELSIIKLCLDRAFFIVVKNIVEVKDLPTELQGIYRILHEYFSEEENNGMSLDDLSARWFATRPKDRDYYIQLFENLQKLEVQEGSVKALCVSLRKGQLLKELSMAAYNASEGDSKALETVREQLAALDKFEAGGAIEELSEFEYVQPDLEMLLDKTYLKPGLRWRLDSLNKSLGSLRPGDFGFAFARTETGKTTFLASEGSFFAEQAIERDLGPILHLNNEGEDEKILLRYYQATLGATLAQILSNREKAQRIFMEKTQGKIILPKLGSFGKNHVERLIDKHKPSIVIVDQVDNIQGFDGDREDLRLGKIYEWLRRCAAGTCPIIGVTQANGDGEGKKWLTMDHVSNAKTSKQATADFIFGIGKIHDDGYDTIRFINISKNKLLGDPDTDPKRRHSKWEVVIEKEIARYRDL